MTWPQVGERAGPDAILAVPLGATEQHGPHLPLSVDTDVAVALCSGLAAARAGVFVAPALPYGSSGEHAAFPGTLSIGQAALELLLVELARSAGETFASVLFVCGHGGNAEPVARAVDLLRAEAREVRAHFPRWQGDPHAGRPETALALALDPTRVRMDLAVPGDLRPLAETLPLMHANGVRAVSPSGVLGDPTGADAAEGAALLAHLVAALVGDVDQWRSG
ncbi:MAG: mycofactocin biosynthesis peptidyl-dipeptidase MftE [Sporichthyaceae bacterium]